MVGNYSGETKRRGSRGVGKIVFSNASQIRTFFGLTRRNGDVSPLLMGEAGLIEHQIAGSDTDYEWYGYFARHESQNGNVIPFPIQDPATVDQFMSAFSVKRAVPGLSIVVPFIRDDINLNDLARAVVEHYFVAILSGRLIDNLCENGQTIALSSAKIDSSIMAIEWPKSKTSLKAEEMLKLLALARWQLSLPQSESIVLAAVGSDRSYEIDRNSFPKGTIDQIAEKFWLRERLAFRIPVHLRPKGQTDRVEEVRLAIERDETVSKGNVPHFRSGIHIAKLREKSPAVRGLLLIGNEDASQGELDKLLQMSEGPAHLDWEGSGDGYDNAKSHYDDAHKVIRLMRNLVSRIVDTLSTPSDERDSKTLAPFFPDADEAGIGGGASKGSTPSGKTGPKKELDAVKSAPPPGVIEGFVRVLSIADGGLRPVQGATIRLNGVDAEGAFTLLKMVDSDGEGAFRFTDLSPGVLQIDAAKESVGEARKRIDLPPENGLDVQLLLRKPSEPQPFTRVQLKDGFRIQGNPKFAGELKPISVTLSYAAWGGGKKHSEADFSLFGNDLEITFSGLQETERSQIVAAANKLRFTPISRDFSVKVNGFDLNRALHVDPRSISEPGKEVDSSDLEDPDE